MLGLIVAVKVTGINSGCTRYTTMEKALNVRNWWRQDARLALVLDVFTDILVGSAFSTRFNTLFMHQGWLLRQMFYIISGFSIRILITKSPHRAGRNGSCK